MFDNSVLNVVIGLIFIFLIYSLLATALQEAAASMFQRRANTLYKGIRSMLTNTEPQGRIIGRLLSYLRSWSGWRWLISWFVRPGANTLYDRFYDHPIIKNYGENALFRKPSYLTADNFSTILIDTIKNLDSFNEAKTADFAMVQGAIINNSDIPAQMATNFPGRKASQTPVIDAETFKILNFHLNEAAGDLNVFKTRLEQWFNDTMERVSGWYKTHTQTWLFVIGFLLAMVMNLDAIQISTHLSKDPKMAAKLADMGTAAAQNQHFKDTTFTNEVLKEINTQKDSINTLLGLGWKYQPGASTGEKICTVLNGTFATSWSVFFGIFISAIAISLGAPFWFDLLNKFVNIRASGKTVGSSGSTTKSNKSDNIDG